MNVSNLRPSASKVSNKTLDQLQPLRGGHHCSSKERAQYDHTDVGSRLSVSIALFEPLCSKAVYALCMRGPSFILASPKSDTDLIGPLDNPTFKVYPRPTQLASG